MGGGDLNMKKSWHPLLLKNQERVWLEEKKAVSCYPERFKPDVLTICLARREKEARAVEKGKGGRTATTRATALAGRANRQEADREARLDVYDPRDGNNPESK